MAARYRVLFDLSTLADGFGDVSQVTWLLYRLLSQTPEVEVTGLVGAPGGALAHHTFADGDERRANQLRFLDRLTAADPDFGGSGRERLRHQLAWYYRLLFAPSASSQELANDLDWHLRLRSFMEQTLSPADLDSFRRGKFLLTTFNRRAMQARLHAGLPAQALETRGFDFAIFQHPCVVRVHRATTKIVCLHDVPLPRPDCVANGLALRRHQAEVRGAAREATFVCRTADARAELSAAYDVPASRGCVIPYPLNGFFSCSSRREQLTRILHERRAPGSAQPADEDAPYFLAVAPFEPRHNHAALFQAFYRLNAHHGNRLRLVVVGKEGWKCASLGPLMTALARQGQLVLLADVKPHELRVLYSHALALVSTAYHEGGTLAPIEAMQCGTPVVLSGTAGHREIAGEAACYCDPYHVESIARAMEQCVSGVPQRRAELIEQGRRHLENFRAEKLRRLWRQLFDAIQQASLGPLERRAA